MNILFISIAWPEAGGRNLYTDLIDEFVLNHHKVFVIGTSESGTEESKGFKNENSINVYRIRSGKIRKTSHLQKTFSLITLNSKILKASKRYLNAGAIDLIIGHTPPVTFSILFRKLKKRYKAPFYLLLKDIWPQGSVDLNVLRKYSIPWFWLRINEKRLYLTADFIGCMSPMGVEYIYRKNKYLDRSRLEVCPNSIKPSDKLPDTDDYKIRSKYGIPRDACIFLFSGNLGIGHGLAFVVDAIKALSGYKKAYFILGGSGTQFRFLEENLKGSGNVNSFLYKWLPLEDYNALLKIIDVGLIFLHKYTVPQFPSRLLSYLDYSKPVLCAVNENTDIGKIVEDYECGISVSHGNLDEFISAVRYLSENKDDRIKMGRRGHKLFLDNYTVSDSYKIIIKHFDGLNLSEEHFAG